MDGGEAVHWERKQRRIMLVWWGGALWVQSGKCWDMVLIGQPSGDVNGAVGCKRLELKRVIWAETVDSDSTEIVIEVMVDENACG